MKEKEGDIFTAVDLYLQGGLPARAAQLVTENQLFNDPALIQHIAQALFKACLYEKVRLLLFSHWFMVFSGWRFLSAFGNERPSTTSIRYGKYLSFSCRTVQKIFS